MLPEPWCHDPQVVVVLAPADCVYQVRGTEDDSTQYGCMAYGENNKRVMGLQILKPETPHYIDQVEMFARAKAPLASPAHIGKVSEIPQRMLTSKDFTPLLFLVDKMSDKFLNMKTAGFGLAKKEGN